MGFVQVVNASVLFWLKNMRIDNVSENTLYKVEESFTLSPSASWNVRREIH